MGYRILWRRLTEAERQRRNAANTATKSARRKEFRAHLAEIEAANAKAEADQRNRDLIGGA